MALADFFKKKENVSEKVNVLAHGSSGTEIYAGYLFEEYLSELRGTKLADIVDKMRRSDPIVTMILGSLKLPLLSQNWYIEKLEESPEAEWQKKLFEKVIFEDMTNSFTKTLSEVLTFNDFGYSLFEKVHGVSYDQELGLYNTIKKLSFRSQRTIESWKVDKLGNLICVYQQADGDTGRNVNIDAKFLVHFSPKQEGDNFEGVSVLRPCYGAWLRKNEFLKLLAAGIEKYAIPTPILMVPAEKATSEEFDNAVEALECYTSNQSAYLTYPEGWDLKTNPVTFDADKVRRIIDAENLEMVNSILASFLLLGQGGAGSFALSKDLSNFFAQGLQAAADHVSEVFDKKILQDVLDLNKPNQKLLCSLRCDNLRDNADQEFANTLRALVDSGIVLKDQSLEDFIREKYKYPKKEVEAQEVAVSATGSAKTIQESAMNGAQIASMVQVVQAVASNTLPRDSAKRILERAFQLNSDEAESLLGEAGKSFEIEPQKPEVLSFAEKKSQKSGKQYQKIMDELSEVLIDFFEGSILIMSGDFIEQLDRANANSRNLYQATLKVDDPSTTNHAKIVEYLTSLYAVLTKKKASRKKLSETLFLSESKIDDLMLQFSYLKDELMIDPTNKEARFKIKEVERKIVEMADAQLKTNLSSNLNSWEKDRLKAKAKVLTDTQASDVYKQVNLLTQSNADKGWSEVRFQIKDKARELAAGPLTKVGGDLMANSTVSQTLYDMSFEDDQGIKSYTYVAEIDDATTDLCLELDGVTLAFDDDRIQEFMPPRHHNCRSFWSPNFDDTELTDFPSLTVAAQDSITLSECCDKKEGAHLANALRSVKIDRV